jgi:hypothetical protein
MRAVDRALPATIRKTSLKKSEGEAVSHRSRGFIMGE